MVVVTPCGVAVDVSRRRRLTDDEVRRVRDRQMYVMRLSGSTPREIGTFFRCTARHINRCLLAIPDAEKRRLREAYRHAPLA